MFHTGLCPDSNYFLLKEGCLNIDKYNCKLEKLCEKKICGSYKGIIYSALNKKNYAFKDNDLNIYILDLDLVEIDKIEIKANDKYLKKIKSISFNGDLGKIIIANDFNVFYFNLEGYFIKE